MKSTKTNRIIDTVAIILGIINVILFMVMPVYFPNSGIVILMMISLILFIILTTIAIITWGIIRLKSFFVTWPGWCLLFALFFIFSLPPQGVWQITNIKLSLFFSFDYLILGAIVAITSAILVFQRDIGLPVFAGGTLIFVWGLFITWSIQGNLVEQGLLSLFLEDVISPLWWLYPILWSLGCLLFFSFASFIFHTFKIFLQELTTAKSS